LRTILLAAVLGLASAASVAAQQRPLVTEDPETIGSGLVLIEGGFTYGNDAPFPVSGLQGNLIQVPQLGVSFGLSSIAEFQIDGIGVQHLNITSRRPAPLSSLLTVTGDSTTDIEDIVVGTKIRLLAEGPGHPAFGVRFATRLPNASNESGLGLDTMDFYATALIGKTTQSVRLVGNVGLGILADPTNGSRQNDVFLYGASIARAVKQGVEIVGEINGRANTRDVDRLPGTESRATLRIGGRVTTGTVRLDGAVLFGMTSHDPDFGFTVGATWVFRGFTVP
jgi:hypothetical protein